MGSTIAQMRGCSLTAAPRVPFSPPPRSDKCRYKRPGQPQQQFARALRQRQGEPGFGVQSRRAARAANSRPPVRPGRPEWRTPRREWPAPGSRAAAHRSSSPASRAIAGSDTPRPVPTNQPTRLKAKLAATGRAAPIGDLHGRIDGLRLAHPLRPVALAHETRRRAHQFAEKAAPLQQIETRPPAAPERRWRSARRCAACSPRRGSRARPERLTPNRAKPICAKVCSVVLTVMVAHGFLHRHAALRQVPRHEHRAADLARRHQAVGGLADPARQEGVAHRSRAPRQRTERGSPRHRGPAAGDETARPAAAPSRRAPGSQSTAGKPCEASTPMNSSTPTDSSQLAARVMAASDRL